MSRGPGRHQRRQEKHLEGICGADVEVAPGEPMSDYAEESLTLERAAYGMLNTEDEVDALEARFVIKNPNAQTTCGCGSSFGV